MKDPKDSTVYFPVESLVGLGHFNRTGKIVREMSGAGMDVTVASGTFVDADRFFAGAKQITLPPYVFKTLTGDYRKINDDGTRSIVPDFNLQAWTQNRIDCHVANMEALHPDVVISEFWPFDRPLLDPEMQAMLTVAQSPGHDALRLVSIRDVVDQNQMKQSLMSDGERQAQAERDEWAVQTINDNFDAVLVHGDPDFIPLDETFPAAGRINREIIYTGYVIDDLPPRNAPQDPRSGPLVVSCGSGMGATEMVLSFLTSWQRLVRNRHVDGVGFMTERPVHIITGPRFYEGAYKEVAEWAQKLGAESGHEIKVEKYRDDFTNILSKAAFSLSCAGYNTSLETLAIGVPALFVPKYNLTDGRTKPSAEQLYRLIRLEQKGLASFAHPDDVQQADVFAARLLNEFITQTCGPKRKASLDFSGAANTLGAISDLLRQDKKGFSAKYTAPAPAPALAYA